MNAKPFYEVEVSKKKSTMTEAKLWIKIKPELSRYGLPIRVDNVAATSVPDVIYIRNDETHFVELKIRQGNRIVFPVYQYSVMLDMVYHTNRM